MTRSVLACFPGVYYYETRYARPFERVTHILKFWLSFPLLLLLLNPASVRASWPLAMVLWLAVLNLYDLGCRENDTRAVARESRPVVRAWGRPVSSRAFLGIKGALAAGLLAGALWLAPDRLMLPTAGFLVGMAACFAIHNRIREAYRLPTFFLLYVGKGVVFLLPGLLRLDGPSCTVLGLFIVLNALTYVPNYAARKVAGHTRDELGPGRIGWVRHLLLQPIMWKNVALAALALSNVVVLGVLVWIDAWTILEWKMGRRIP